MSSSRQDTMIDRSCEVPPTLNASWVLSTVLCFWFLFIHSPIVLFRKDSIEPLLYVHLVGAYSIYLVCVHNTLLTPSTFGGLARPFHIWGGRIGLVLGTIGFFSGCVLTWIVLDPQDDMGFSIGITIGGISQILCQVFGYRSIRLFQEVRAKIKAKEYKNSEELLILEDEQDKHLCVHVIFMVNLFVQACGVPAAIRLGGMMGVIATVLLILLLICLSYFMAQPILKKIKAKRANERSEGMEESFIKEQVTEKNVYGAT